MKAFLKTLPFLLVSLSTIQGAPELNPAIVPLAAKHKEGVTKLLQDAEKTNSFARDSYLVVLDQVEKEIVEKSDAKGVELITSERAGAKTDSLPEAVPAELPRKLLGARRSLIKAIAKSDEDVDKGAKKLNSIYVAGLNGISGAKDDAQLAEQIDREKKRIISSIGGPVLNLQTDLAGTRWKYQDKIVTFTTDGRWNGERYATPAPNILEIHWNGGGKATLTLAPEGNVILHNGKPDMFFYRGPSK
ncbi:hypothetical protein [Luteolibacter sp. Populi]|uniref:hypothetical protein n=1 Tax=Luteolibacter sp. Populi TaxID=3230487 RepID=UPI003465DBD7